MTSLVIGLIQPGFENMRSKFEPATSRFPDVQEREAGTLNYSASLSGLVAVRMFVYYICDLQLSMGV